MKELENIKSELSPFVGEHRLVVSAIAGDKKAFSELYKQTYKGIYFIVKKYLTNDDDIYEAMQETYFKAYVNLRFLREPESFYGWLKIIAQNTAIDILKSSKNNEAFVEVDAQSDFSDAKNDLNIEIADILKKLEPQYADLLIKVYYDGLKVKEIAKLYKLPKSTVYSRLKTAENKLREMLEIRGIDGPLYGGDIASMLTLAFRQLIGTDILKAAVMEEILQKVLKGDKNSKVVGALARKKRNAAILRLTSIIMAFVMLITVATVVVIDNFGGKNINDFGLVTNTDYIAITDGVPLYALAVKFNDSKYATIIVSSRLRFLVDENEEIGTYKFVDRTTATTCYTISPQTAITVKYKIGRDGMAVFKNDYLTIKCHANSGRLIFKEGLSSVYEQLSCFEENAILSTDITMIEK